MLAVFTGLSGTCKRGRQKGVSLICSENKYRNRSEDIGANRNKSEQIPENKERKLEQIGRKRGDRNESEQIGVTPLLPTKPGAPRLTIYLAKPLSWTRGLVDT